MQYMHKNLSVRHVQVQVQIVVQGCCDARPAGTKMEEVAMVTGPAACSVVSGTGGARGGWGAHNAGNDSLAGGLFRRTNAAPHLLRERAQYSVVITVEQRLGPAQPETNRPAEERDREGNWLFSNASGLHHHHHFNVIKTDL